jgi:hypothetical protein
MNHRGRDNGTQAFCQLGFSASTIADYYNLHFFAQRVLAVDALPMVWKSLQNPGNGL